MKNYIGYTLDMLQSFNGAEFERKLNKLYKFSLRWLSDTSSDTAPRINCTGILPIHGRGQVVAMHTYQPTPGSRNFNNWLTFQDFIQAQVYLGLEGSEGTAILGGTAINTMVVTSIGDITERPLWQVLVVARFLQCLEGRYGLKEDFRTNRFEEFLNSVNLRLLPKHIFNVNKHHSRPV